MEDIDGDGKNSHRCKEKNGVEKQKKMMVTDTNEPCVT